MWFFGKDKDKKGTKKGGDDKAPPALPVIAGTSSKQAKAQALMAQMRTLRAEIGEENLQEMVRKLKLDSLKQQMREDIDHDPKKRDRLLDELRFNLRDDDKPGRH